jgi:hypothetical protein
VIANLVFAESEAKQSRIAQTTNNYDYNDYPDTAAASKKAWVSVFISHNKYSPFYMLFTAS